MRTRKEIKQEMTRNFVGNTTIQELYGLTDVSVFENEFSLVSLENILFEIISTAIWTLETLFDTHKSEVETLLATKLPHTANWYRDKAKAFQDMDALPENSDVYPTADPSKMIVKYSAVTETDGKVLVKIATENNGVLSPILPDQQERFSAYMARIKDAGVRLEVINYEPDKLFINLTIYRDPLVIDGDGYNGEVKKPVEIALQAYLKTLPFDGELVLAHLVDALQGIPGVKIPHLNSVLVSWANQQQQAIGVKYTPVSGYFKIENWTITYLN